MRWTERQRAMLREMGVPMLRRESPGQVVLPAAGGTVPVVPTADAPVASETNSPRRVPAPPSPPTPVTLGLVHADWLILGDSFDPDAGPQSAAIADEQERLLGNMLFVLRLSLDAPRSARRACYLAMAEGAPIDIGDAIDRVRPKVVLALGRAAAQALLAGDEPLGGRRGRVHDRSGVPVVVTFSLAYLLRHPADKAKAWADLCLAAAAAEKATI